MENGQQQEEGPFVKASRRQQVVLVGTTRECGVSSSSRCSWRSDGDFVVRLVRAIPPLLVGVHHLPPQTACVLFIKGARGPAPNAILKP